MLVSPHNSEPQSVLLAQPGTRFSRSWIVVVVAVLEVRDSGFGFKVAVRFFVGWLDMTLGVAGTRRASTENCWRILVRQDVKLIRKPSQVGSDQLP